MLGLTTLPAVDAAREHFVSRLLPRFPPLSPASGCDVRDASTGPTSRLQLTGERSDHGPLPRGGRASEGRREGSLDGVDR